MTELEWCRQNAPDALKGLSDRELVEVMHSSYTRFCVDRAFTINIDTMGFDLSDKQQRLDHLVMLATETLHDKMALKGGYLLSRILGDRGRKTQDVDFDVLDQKAYDYLIPTIEALGEYYIKSGLATEYKIRHDLSGDKSGGFTVYNDKVIILKCDICSENLSYGLSFTQIGEKEVQTFSPERILADKVLALLSEKRFRRSKDIYDVLCITDCFKCDARLINSYMRKRLTSTEGVWDDFPYSEEILTKMEVAYSKLRLSNIKDEVIPKPDWSKVADRFMIFASKVKSPSKPYIWDKERGIFV